MSVGWDLRLGVSPAAAFERLQAEAGLALQLVGQAHAFEVLATPQPSPYEDGAWMRCVLRGRLTARTHGASARARVLVRPHAPDLRCSVGGWPWAASLNPVPTMIPARDRLARLRRQRRAMLRLWAAALGPVVVIGGEDPFRASAPVVDLAV